MSNTLAIQSAELVRQSTDIAGLCKEIVLKSAMDIQGRKYVKVEGWMAIATAHGCIASCRDVTRVDGGFRAIGEIRRMADGAVLCTAEGFVGEDEPTWFGGTRGDKQLPKRPDYAIRAMAQTRAISRACRSAFAHVVVLMDAGLSTTPAEEVPDGGFDAEQDHGTLTDDAVPGMYWTLRKEHNIQEADEWLSKAYEGAKVGVRKTEAGWRVVIFGKAPAKSAKPDKPATKAGNEAPDDKASQGEGNPGDWRKVRCHFGKKDGPILGKELGELPISKLEWLLAQMSEKPDEKRNKDDRKLLAALTLWDASRKTGKTEAQPASDPKPGGNETEKVNLEVLAQNLDYASVDTDAFLILANAMGWTKAGTFAEITDCEARDMVDNIDHVIESCREGGRA